MPILGPHEPLARDEECDRILDSYGPHRFDAVSIALDRQFQTIHNRAQLLLGICGVLISASVLAATGRLVARPDFPRLSRVFLAVAGSLNVAAIVVIVGVVMSVRWISQQPGTDLRAWVLVNLAYRDAKTRAYRLSIALVLLSMLLYQSAVTVALIHS